MINWFSRGRDTEPALPVERGPLGIAIGGALEIDLLSLQADTVAAEPGMPLPDASTFIVAAYGEARLDAASVLSRYYDEQHRMLQVLSDSGQPGDAPSDVSLYHPWDSVVPVGSSEWARWIGPQGLLGQSRYDADGILFQRYWGEGDARADLVEFVEEVDDGDRKRSIHQTCMLYWRPLGSTREMLLINVERDLGERDARQGRSVEFLLGYGLAAADVKRV